VIIFAGLGTALAVLWTAVVLFANGMRSSQGEFFGLGSIIIAWIGVAVLWLAWWFN